jgi:hypothetical protein
LNNPSNSRFQGLRETRAATSSRPVDPCRRHQSTDGCPRGSSDPSRRGDYHDGHGQDPEDEGRPSYDRAKRLSRSSGSPRTDHQAQQEPPDQQRDHEDDDATRGPARPTRQYRISWSHHGAHSAHGFKSRPAAEILPGSSPDAKRLSLGIGKITLNGRYPFAAWGSMIALTGRGWCERRGYFSTERTEKDRRRSRGAWTAPALLTVGASAMAGSPPPTCVAGNKYTSPNGTVGTTCCGPADCSGTQGTIPNQCYVSPEGVDACAANLNGPRPTVCSDSSTCPVGQFCSGSVCVTAA